MSRIFFLFAIVLFIFQAMSDLHVLFLKNGIKHISSESFRDNARVQMENLKVTIRPVFTRLTQMKNLVLGHY